MSLTLNGSAGVTTNSGAVYDGLQSGTAVASTSGTSIDFTGIPAWVKRITVMFNGVSTNGTSNLLLQIGSGSITSSGYNSVCSVIAGSVASTQFSTGYGLTQANGASNVNSGVFSIVLLSAASNSWQGIGNLSTVSGTQQYPSVGQVALSGTLDRVRITTVNGTDTFDAGSINIIYE